MHATNNDAPKHSTPPIAIQQSWFPDTEQTATFNSSSAQCERNQATISRLTRRPESWVDKMMLDRHGQFPDSGMQTHGLHTVVERRSCYRVSVEFGLIPVTPNKNVIDLERDVIENRHQRPPAHSSFVAGWDTRIYCHSSGENALGDNGLMTLVSQNQMLNIPVIDADRDSLLYYGATLVEDQSIVRFPNKRYPIWHVGIGRNYVDGFIMSELGNGFYLEYHNDRPHWHQPLSSDCGGVYILARKVDSDERGTNRYHISGFRIPYGTGLYSGNGIIHCDAGLTGRHWLMGYDESNDFSTALIRNTVGEMVKLVPMHH